jgi:bacillithiol system protein YtxJ
MAAEIRSLESLAALDELLEKSHQQPIVVFKHSSSCGISSHIFENIQTVEAEINVVVVQRNRDVSNAIEQRTGYRHQSPQAFVIRDGKAVYHASHYGIDPAAIEGLLND